MTFLSAKDANDTHLKEMQQFALLHSSKKQTAASSSADDATSGSRQVRISREAGRSKRVFEGLVKGEASQEVRELMTVPVVITAE